MSRISELQRRVGRAISELQKPNPRSADNQTSRMVGRSGYDTARLSKGELDDYWEIYKTVPIVRTSIRGFASEVISPGIFVEADTEENEKKLNEWIRSASISNGVKGTSLETLFKDMTIQREVRGTAFVEKVYTEDGEKFWGYKMMPADSVKVYTKPGQAILLGPDDEAPDGLDVRTPNGETPAYVQYDDALRGYENDEPIAFTSHDIIKIVRDADAGEVMGTSRLVAVEDRINSLQTKIDANDEAILSKAFKFWLFKFGNAETGYWDPDSIDDFMANHSSENFAPDMKEGVQGDVEVETISGETAEIAEYLQFDVNWIMSEMPMPKFALGGFEENVNQFVTRSQETRVAIQVREARREIENEFTPSVRDKAEEMGISPESVRLRIGDTDAEIPPTDYTRPPASEEGPREEAPGEEEGSENEERTTEGYQSLADRLT